MKLARERYDVHAVMPKGSDEKIVGYLQRLGVACEFFDVHVDSSPANSVWQKITRRLRNVYCQIALACYLNSRPLKHSILHLDIGPWAWFGLLAYLSMRSNVFVTLHIAVLKLSWLRRMEWKLKFRALSLIPGFHLLASNRDMLNSLKSYLPDHFLASVPVAYTGIDVSEIQQTLELKLDREDLREKYNLPAERCFVFSLAQVIPRKGCLVLLETVRKLRETNPALFFVWIGDGILRKEIEQRVEQEGLQESFRIIRPAEIGPERLDLLSLVRLADIFVHPSFSEGLPGAVLEAMALGKACVASRVNAIPEVIRDHETGLLVPPGDSTALAGAICELIFDPALRERLAKAGQSYVLMHFDERNAAKVTVDYYDRCRRGL